MDKAQLSAFVDYMIGWKSIGTAGEEEITAPICPEMRAFVLARLGDKTPTHGYEAVHNPNAGRVFSELLREVADDLGSPELTLDHAQRLILSLLKSNDAQDCKDAERYLKQHRPDLANLIDGSGPTVEDRSSEGPLTGAVRNLVSGIRRGL